MGYIRSIMRSKDLKDNARMSEKDFTRNRKVGFFTLMCMILNMIKKSTQLEIDDFMKMFNPEGVSQTYTKQSFSEARQKLSPEAFKILNEAFVRKFYEDGDYKKYKGYRLLAIDGSWIEVPDNKETRKYFGCIRNPKGGLRPPRALSSQVYDIENRILLDSILGRYDDGERKLALRNIENIKSHRLENVRDLILFDRGYPSLALICHLGRDIKFLMRAKTGFLKEIDSMQSPDEQLSIEITRDRARELRKQGTPLPLGEVITLRALKVELESGEIEVLVTNLTTEELRYEEAKGLYFKRWGIETKFDELKNKFEIENFSGEKPLLVEQDFYATVFLSNIASMFEQEAEEELKEKNAKKELKHEYKVNKSLLVGKFKNNLIEMLLEDDEEKQSMMYSRFVEEIKRNVVPIIKDRAFERKDYTYKANKYSRARKRSL